MKPRSLLPLFVIGLGYALGSAQASPRDTVNAVAGQIRQQYFDAERAGQIADDLQKEAAQGRYDQHLHPGELASALSQRLYPLDHHFQVRYDAPVTPAATVTAQTAPAPRLPVALNEKRSNYGFRKVEILPGNIGYLELDRFALLDFNEPQSPAKRAADAALAVVANSSGLIIDLRQNGGGTPQMAGYLISAFVAKDAQIYNHFLTRDGEFAETPEMVYAEPRTHLPLAILTSARTASAGETVPYTLQAAKRATVVGERTAGGANPGGFFPIADGFSIFVSTGSPVNPITKSNWEGVGVAPDVEVSAEQALAVAHKKMLQHLLAQTGNEMHSIQRWALEGMADASPGQALQDYVGDFGRSRTQLIEQQLSLQREGRPALMLKLIAKDRFATSNPDLRVVFARNAKQEIDALEVHTIDGAVMRLPRLAPANS